MAASADSAAARLLELGAHLGIAGKHRLAALAYATAAEGASGASPAAHADALFHSARHLHESAVARPAHPCVESDLRRARGLIHKALLLVRELPDAFRWTMRLLALLESVHVTKGEFDDAIRASKRAMSVMKRAMEDGGDIWAWWIFFRARSISVHVSHLRAPEEALQTTSSSATHMQHLGEREAAAAFLLSGVHIRLAAPGFDLSHVLPSLQQAAHLLSEANVPENSPLAIARVILHGLSLLRAGYATAARNELAATAVRTLASLDRRGAASGRSLWVWAPSPVLRVLLQHFLACALRTHGDGGAAWVHAEQALSAAGLSRDPARAPVCGGRVTPKASRALACALLDSAARVRLALVDFPRAAPLVAAALVRGKTADGPDAAQCSAFLVAAEYYALSGQHDRARDATAYLQRIVQAASTREMSLSLGDILQKALTYRSLLLGTARLASLGASLPYTSAHERAAGLLADGVFQLRHSRVIEAREALQSVMAIMQDDNSRNEQVLANSLIVLSSLFLVHEQISEAPVNMTLNATRLAQAARDAVTEARAKRQTYKILARMRPKSVEAGEAYGESRGVMEALGLLQSSFQELVLQ